MEQSIREPLASAGVLNYSLNTQKPRWGFSITALALFFGVLPYASAAPLYFESWGAEGAYAWLGMVAWFSNMLGWPIGINFAVLSMFGSSRWYLRIGGGIALVLLMGWIVVLATTDVPFKVFWNMLSPWLRIH